MPGEEFYNGDTRVGDIIRCCLFMTSGERCTIGEIEEVQGGRKIYDVSHAKRLLRKVPGFRTGNRAHMTLAMVEYIDMSLIYVFPILLRQSAGQIFTGTVSFLLVTLGVGQLIGTWKQADYRLHMEKGAGRVALIILYGGYRFPFGVRTYGNSIKTDEDRNAVSLTR